MRSFQEKECDNFESKPDKSGKKGATKYYVPLVPALIGFIVGSLLGKLFILLFRVMFSL